MVGNSAKGERKLESQLEKSPQQRSEQSESPPVGAVEEVVEGVLPKEGKKNKNSSPGECNSKKISMAIAHRRVVIELGCQNLRK